MITSEDPVDPVEGVFDLTARRTAKTLQDEVGTLKARIAELQKQSGPPLDHEQSHGGIHAKSECRFHPAVVVDESQLMVTCRHCGVEVDPFVVLLEFAKKERHFYSQLEWARDERRGLAAEVSSLKQERNRIRSQVNAAKKRLVELRAQGAEPCGST